MAEKVPMTALSPTMEEGTIASWSVKEGDTISAGDALCEVETDKASMEYEATQEGTLLKIIVGPGGSAVVGQTIAIIGESGEDVSEILASARSEGSDDGPSGKTDADVSEGQSKSTSVESTEGSSPKETSGGSAPKSAVQPHRPDGARIVASPLAAKMAAERNINLSSVNGSGPGGRIVKRDIEAFRGMTATTFTPAPGRSTASFAAPPGDQEVPVTGKRAVIARRLSESKFTAPHYYLKMSVEMANVFNARKLLNETLPHKVSLNAFFIKFSAEAIKRHPHINASWQGDTIIRYGSIDVGIAVDLGNGLITPVVRDCGNRGIVEIDGDLQELIRKAGDGKLRPEEYTGATFTISNLGSFGVEEFTAIINPPGSAILALGATRRSPVVKDDGTIGVGSIMKMTLSCDHRVIDGAAGGRFLSDLSRMMEQPVRMIF